MNNNPLFTIVVPHYQWDGKAGIKHEDFIRGMKCIQNQTFTDYEVLVIHDGPAKNISQLAESPFPVRCLAVRYNDWGHSLRDMGIKRAKGKYIVMLNSDNILYPFALEKIAEAINDTSFQEVCKELSEKIHVGSVFPEKDPVALAARIKDIIVFPVYLRGVKAFGQFQVDFRPIMEDSHDKIKHLLSGYPVVPNFIDAMQVVIKKSLWVKEGGWHLKHERSDGFLYEKIVRDNSGCTHLYEPLGEHA